MAARSKALIYAQLQKVVSPYIATTPDAASNPGNYDVQDSSSMERAQLGVLLIIAELLLNIRQGESAP